MTWTHAASLAHAAAATPWLSLTIGRMRLILALIDGAWYAVEDSCSHSGCAFSADGELDGTDLICNCHGSEFDARTGEVRRGPAEAPIRTLPVRVVGDRLEVDL